MASKLSREDELDILKEAGLDSEQWHVYDTPPIIPGQNPPPLLGEDEISLKYPAHRLPTGMLSIRAQSERPQAGIPVRALWPVQAPGKPNSNSAIVSQVAPVKKSVENVVANAPSGNTQVVSVSATGTMQKSSLGNAPKGKLPVAPITQDNLGDGVTFSRLLTSATVSNKVAGQHISNQSVGIVLPLTIFSGAISGANALWLLAGLAPMNIPVGVNSITFNIKFSQSGAGVQTVDQVGISIAASLPSSPAVSATASLTGVNLTVNNPISGNPNNCILWIFFKMKGGSNSTFTLTASTGVVNTISPIEIT